MKSKRETSIRRLFAVVIVSLFALTCSRNAPQPASADADGRRLMAEIDHQYRLQPDTRFVLAVADVSELLTEHHDRLTVGKVGDRWAVRSGNDLVGELPGMPSFADGMRFLDAWAQRIARDHSKSGGSHGDFSQIDAETEAFDLPHLFKAARMLDEISSKAASMSLWQRRAKIAALTNIQVADRFETADDVRARGLAALAVAHANDKACCLEESALMAHALGYESEAIDLARQLPSNSPAAALILGSNTTAGGKLSAYANARQRLQKATVDEREGIISAIDAPSAANLLGYTDIRDTTLLSRRVAQRLIVQLGGEAGAEESPSASLLPAFERALGNRAENFSSRLFRPTLIRSTYRALFYSAICREFDYHFDIRGDRAGADAFAASARDAAVPGDQVIRWMRDAIALKYDGAKSVDLRNELQKMPDLGPHPVIALFRSDADWRGVHDPEVLGLFAVTMQYVDSRPDNLFDLGGLAGTYLRDPRRRDLYVETAILRSPEHHGWLGWYAGIIKDKDRLWSIARSDAGARDRANALAALGTIDREHDGEIRSLFDAMVSAGDISGVYERYVEFLNSRKDWQTKERVARTLLDQPHRDITDVRASYLASSLSDALEHQHRYDEARDVLSPYLPVFSFNIVWATISVLTSAGDIDQANALADQLMARYPGVASRVVKASIDWHTGHYDDAAKLLDASREAYSSDDLSSTFPWVFADAFAEAPPSELRKAVESLVPVLSPGALTGAVSEFQNAGDPERAFAVAEIVSGLPKRENGLDPDSALLLAWQILRDWKGADEANTWIEPHWPRERASGVLLAAHRDGLHQLVLRMAAPTLPGGKNQEYLMLETASLLAAHVPRSDPRFQNLTEIVNGQASDPTSFQTVTRFLLGLNDANALFAWPKNKDQIITALYFYGLKEAAEGRYDEAERWLVAAGAQPEDAWGKYFAHGMLQRWSVHSWSDVKRSGMM